MRFSLFDRIRAIGVAAFVAFGLAACGSGDDDPVPVAQPKDIVDVAQENADFSILVEAVVAADLVATLKSDGPFTVFAPTNDAFAALLTELGVTKDQLLADKALLTQVLTYHVLGAKVEAADVAGVLGKAVGTVEGGIFKIEDPAGELTITDERNRSARIVATDVAASNGVIHVIDRVILPGDKTVVDTAIAASTSASPEFTILVEALLASDPSADLVNLLSGDGPFTVFAPTDAAFAALLTELGVSKAELLADTALLTEVLKYHVVPGRVLKAEVPVGTPIATAQGQSFEVNGSQQIIDARGRSSGIAATDVLARNGVIHVIDTVILPAP
ncbi:fasciclin domain-containing protein [Burkholderiaceae bacterium FT117]|uniref:fasciclin domain-containing protein n=1 Tax=Zeimonas sediminis TaxID=2944268 RepID=UPI002342F519|nr:fasciclin domain-containing protein [Zeimonas sediminis]MCM5571895.1 fasciclin domain-containing protein [Zeimonas sediminis]